MAASTYFAQVQQLYIAYFGRPADPTGQEYWAKNIDAANGSIASVIAGFSASAESAALFGNKSSIDKVTAIYQNAFGRAPEPAGLAYWVAQLDSGKVSQAQASWTIQQSAGPGDAAAVQNKLTAAQAFTAQIDTTAEIQGYQGSAAAESARAFLKTVTADNATATAAVNGAAAAVAAATSVGVVGTTFTLTNGVDNLVGDNGNNLFIAGSQAGLATLTAGDQINGGAGTDTLNIFGNANATAFTGATVSNVEVVNALFDATGAALNVSGNAGVTQVNIGNSALTNAAGSGVATVTLAKAQVAGINGTILNDTTTSAAGNNVAVAFAFSDVTGGADTATLNVNNAKFALNAANIAGTGNGVTIAGVETLNVVAAGTNALGNLTAAQTTKLVITGAGSLNATLAQVAGLTKTIDGSAATGNLTINNAAATAAIESIKTGSGNDTYTTLFTSLAKDDVIDLGAGTDSLRFSDAATFTTDVQKAQLTGVAGVEQLGTVGAALTVDGNFVSQTSFYTDGATGQFVGTNLANATALTFGAGAELASTAGLKLGAKDLTVNLAGSETAASNVTAGLTVTGSATVTVNSTGTVGQANNVLALTAADNQSVVVTGAQNLTLTTTAAPATTGFSIDGSAFTGKLTVTGTAASDIIKGGSGDDIISGGAGVVGDTLTGGAGKDKFVIVAGVTAAAADTITDFVTKVDSISFGAAVLAANVTKGAAVVADFAAALAAANLVLVNTGGTATQVNLQQVGADTYAFYNDAQATLGTHLLGADQVVKLSGVALTGVDAVDFVA